MLVSSAVSRGRSAKIQFTGYSRPVWLRPKNGWPQS